jgi:hypothetical protein
MHKEDAHWEFAEQGTKTTLIKRGMKGKQGGMKGRQREVKGRQREVKGIHKPVKKYL